METKRPPRVSDPETSNAVNQIYDDLNAIANAVGTGQGQTHKEGSSTEGEIGDIKIGRAGLGKYAVMAKTEDGWVESDELSFMDKKDKREQVLNIMTDAPSLLPTYDSGWVAVSMNNNYDFNHNLGSKMLSLVIYLKDGSENILLLGADSYGNYLGDNYESGISVYMETDNKLNIGTGNDAIYVHDNTSLGGSVPSNKITSGHIRVFAWKIEVSV